MTTFRPSLKLTALAAMLLTMQAAHATNGMNMEGYGPISTGLGGVSQAIDHGTAAMAQNPATMALMREGARLDVALGILGPKVASAIPGFGQADSSGTRYTMPGIGYARRTGALTWGIGMFAQGGMGTEYGADTFLAAGSGKPVRSELSVGRVLIPLVWQATPELAIGGSIDYLWAGLDMRMALSGAQLGGLVTGASGTIGGMLQGFGQAPWARIDFSNSSDFTGEAHATGWAGKIGAVYKAGPDLTFGASYQFESSLSDLKTSSQGATMSAAGGFADSGRITVIDFQWPAMTAIGLAWQAAPAWLIGADVKRIDWSGVMKDFRLRYDSAGLGGSVSFALPQQWKNQTVTNVGVAYAVNPELTLRAGVNVADNPIPDAFVNPLFPATVKTHYTAGLRYRVTPKSEFNGALTVAPKSTVTNGMGVVVTHRQQSWQFMFTQQF